MTLDDSAYGAYENNYIQLGKDNSPQVKHRSPILRIMETKHKT